MASPRSLDGWRSVLEPSREVTNLYFNLNIYPNRYFNPNPYLKLAPRWLKIALCWLKLVPRRPTWPPKASQVPQDETKMASKMASTSICFSFLVFFSRFASGPTFSNEFLLFGSLECINFCQFLEQISMNFGSFLASWVVYAPRGLKIASRLLQDGLLEPIWTQHGPKLAPSWFRLDPCWPQVGSNLPQVGSMLDADPGPQPPLSQPKPFPTPSL